MSLVINSKLRRRTRIIALCCSAVCLGSRDLDAEILPVTDSAGFQAALGAALAGDEIVLAPGTYPGRFTAIGLTGVTIRSADPQNRAVINAEGVGEGLKLSSIKDVTIADLIVENADVNGINIDDTSHVAISENVTLRGILVRNSTENGIKLTAVDNFHVDRVRVVNWGPNHTAVDMIGSHHGLVERSYFENTTAGFGTGVQTKAGSADVVIRANRFVNANERSIQIGGSSALGIFRPQPPGDVEASGIIAEGNVILHNGGVAPGVRAGASFINVADGIFRNNIVVRPSRYFLRILKENREEGFLDTQNGTVSDNIFLWNHGDLFGAVNAGPQTLPETFRFEGNQWFNMTSPGDSQPALPVAEVDGIYGIDPHVDFQGITPWSFSWGKWLVNTSNLVDSITLPLGESYVLATPGAGAEFDLSAQFPLLGNWSLAPVTQTEFVVDLYSHSVLLFAGFSPIPGDYNGDRVVDTKDYQVWKSTFGSTDSLGADGNANRIVDAADFAVWRNAMLTSTAAASLSVPEPGTIALAILLSVLIAASYAKAARSNHCFDG